MRINDVLKGKPSHDVITVAPSTTGFGSVSPADVTVNGATLDADAAVEVGVARGPAVAAVDPLGAPGEGRDEPVVLDVPRPDEEVEVGGGAGPAGDAVGGGHVASLDVIPDSSWQRLSAVSPSVPACAPAVSSRS